MATGLVANNGDTLTRILNQIAQLEENLLADIGAPATIADGADVAQGATTDAVVAAGAAGTVSAKLRRLTTDLNTLLGYADGLETNTAALLTGTILAAGEAHIGQVGGRSVRVRVEKTRPNDTNAYAANDAINESASAGSNWSFAVGRIAAGSGVIVGATIACDDIVTSLGTLELDLYDDTITDINDNSEATRLYANQGKFIRTLVFPALAKKTANSDCVEAELNGLNIPFKCVAGGLLDGVLRAVTGFTPVANKKFTITLAVLQD